MKQAEITALLPEIMQRAVRDRSPLAALLDVMEQLHEPSEELLHKLDQYFDPQRTRADLVPMLGHWLGLEETLVRRAAKSRTFVARAVELWKWRGTAWAVTESLEIATGVRGFVVTEEPPGPLYTARPFHFFVTAPAGVSKDKEVIEKVIEMQKPAYVTYEIIWR